MAAQKLRKDLMQTLRRRCGAGAAQVDRRQTKRIRENEAKEGLDLRAERIWAAEDAPSTCLK
jgi:recombination DNA repair RAD52 pathway protein